MIVSYFIIYNYFDAWLRQFWQVSKPEIQVEI